MLRNNDQMSLDLSPYQGLYDAIIPKDHILRRMKENIDFSFVNPMLRKQYCEHFGRPAKEPEMMFKLCFLKKLYDLSDERLISSAQTDMAYKSFLGLSPEDKMIDASLLTKFRKTRITEDILEEMLKETIQQAISDLLSSDRIREIRSKDDEDARFGHKTPTHTFFGYKTHMAMSDDRIITGIEVTDGSQADGPRLKTLIQKTKANGVNVQDVVGDMAYVSDENLEMCERENVTLYARTNSAVSSAAKAQLDEGFSYNKDAKRLQCPAGHLAMRVETKKQENGNTYLTYVFSKPTCKQCPLRDKCRVGCSKTKSYSITQASDAHNARLEFEESEEFRKKLEIRHRIEEKNGEMKSAHGLQRADSSGLVAMRLQAYFTAYVANFKRIVNVLPA